MHGWRCWACWCCDCCLHEGAADDVGSCSHGPAVLPTRAYVLLSPLMLLVLVLCCMLLLIEGSCMAPPGAVCATLLTPLVPAMLTLAMLMGPELVLLMLTLTLLMLRCMSLGGGCMASLHACSMAVVETVCAVMSACCWVLLLRAARASLSCMMSWHLSSSSWLMTFFSWLLIVASRSFPWLSSRLCALQWMSSSVGEVH